MSKEEALAIVVVTAVGGSSLPALSLVESVSSLDCDFSPEVEFALVWLSSSLS